jgi:uncharacterized membrane protein YfcA
MLDVAGGELLIPALIFGADFKIAGMASLIISLFIATGVCRYHRAGALPMRGGPRESRSP